MRFETNKGLNSYVLEENEAKHRCVISGAFRSDNLPTLFERLATAPSPSRAMNIDHYLWHFPKERGRHAITF